MSNFRRFAMVVLGIMCGAGIASFFKGLNDTKDLTSASEANIFGRKGEASSAALAQLDAEQMLQVQAGRRGEAEATTREAVFTDKSSFEEKLIEFTTAQGLLPEEWNAKAYAANRRLIKVDPRDIPDELWPVTVQFTSQAGLNARDHQAAGEKEPIKDQPFVSPEEARPRKGTLSSFTEKEETSVLAVTPSAKPHTLILNRAKPTLQSFESSDPPDHVSGGSLWPLGSASSYPWPEAKGRLVNLPIRKKGLQETIWASANRTTPCGSPCVAHCIAGQPRDIASNKGLWKAYRHRLFDRFSDEPVVFALYAASAWGGGRGAGDGFSGYVRTPVQSVSDTDLLPGMRVMGVDRAVIIREACTTGPCMQKGAGLSCVARALKVTAQFDRKTKNVTNFCDVQVRRLQSCMHLVREYEQDYELSFKWVARDRPDVYFAEPSARYTKLREDTVYLKPWAPCGFGGMDWWYVMPRHHADTMSRFPDDMQCSYLQHPKVMPVCKSCIGCECFLAAWMYSQKIKFAPFPQPWDGFIPLKFCGGGCPPDWKVSQKSICRGFCEGRSKIPDAKQKK